MIVDCAEWWRDGSIPKRITEAVFKFKENTGRWPRQVTATRLAWGYLTHDRAVMDQTDGIPARIARLFDPPRHEGSVSIEVTMETGDAYLELS